MTNTKKFVIFNATPIFYRPDRTKIPSNTPDEWRWRVWRSSDESKVYDEMNLDQLNEIMCSLFDTLPDEVVVTRQTFIIELMMAE